MTPTTNPLTRTARVELANARGRASRWCRLAHRGGTWSEPKLVGQFGFSFIYSQTRTCIRCGRCEGRRVKA